MKKVCVIGSCVCDVILQIPTLPKRSEDINAISQTMNIGGCAYNIAHMLSLYGLPFTLFSPIGQGVYGDFVKQQLIKEHIPMIIPRVEENNGCCYCIVEEDGERSFISVHGAEYKFNKAWFSLLQHEDYDSAYVCGIELEEQEGHVIVEYLEKHPFDTLYFAPGPRFQNIDANLLKRMFSLSPILHLNEDESLRLSGKKTYQEAATYLYIICKNTIVITLGSSGAYIKEHENSYHVKGYPTHVKDTIGAGDAHLGALIAERQLDHPFLQAIKNANKIASAVVKVEGSTLDTIKLLRLETVNE